MVSLAPRPPGCAAQVRGPGATRRGCDHAETRCSLGDAWGPPRGHAAAGAAVPHRGLLLSHPHLTGRQVHPIPSILPAGLRGGPISQGWGVGGQRGPAAVLIPSLSAAVRHFPAVQGGRAAAGAAGPGHHTGAAGAVPQPHLPGGECWQPTPATSQPVSAPTASPLLGAARSPPWLRTRWPGCAEPC